MDDDSLTRRLKQSRIPPPDHDATTRALHHALEAFQAAPSVPPSPPLWSAPRVVMGLAVIAVVGLVLMARPQTKTPQPPTPSWTDIVARERHVLQEALMLFPTDLRALITKNGDTQVLVWDELHPAASQPLVVELERNGQVTRVVTFSGERLEIECDGQTLTVDLLVTGEDKVVVAGEDFVWSNDLTATPHGFGIHAHPLGI